MRKLAANETREARGRGWKHSSRASGVEKKALMSNKISNIKLISIVKILISAGTRIAAFLRGSSEAKFCQKRAKNLDISPFFSTLARRGAENLRKGKRVCAGKDLRGARTSLSPFPRAPMQPIFSAETADASDNPASARPARTEAPSTHPKSAGSAPR